MFPRDDGPHDRLTEWWYYTGHLEADDGHRFGFEAVVFRAERGAVPAAWAAHLALTDEGNPKSFHYAQRSEIGSQVDRSPRDQAAQPTGFDLRVSGGAGETATPWQLSGSAGKDNISAELSPAEATAAGRQFGLTLDLQTLKPAALHDHDGFVDFGPAGSSYYYSRTRMAAVGEVEVDGKRLGVIGTAWFDHQWGDFVSVGGGGWDWFAMNLDDGTDITGSIVMDADDTPVLQYGTLVAPSGEVSHLDQGAFEAFGDESWLSARTGRVYPGHWQVVAGRYQIDLRPTVQDQELDTRSTTGVVYWEGSQQVEGFSIEQNGLAPIVGGEAYVEMTRYGD
jgi:predicted secreted hydrolase